MPQSIGDMAETASDRIPAMARAPDVDPAYPMALALEQAIEKTVGARWRRAPSGWSEFPFLPDVAIRLHWAISKLRGMAGGK